MFHIEPEIMPITTDGYLYLSGTPFRAMQGEFNEFDLNVFFSAMGVGESAKFTYEDEVQKWLDLIRGSFLPTSVDNLKLGAQKPPMPFSDTRLLNVLSHMFWFLPSVAACHAMRNLLAQKQNRFYHDYRVIVAAGSGAGVGINKHEGENIGLYDTVLSLQDYQST